jgi:hypothetical protein
MLQSNKQIKAEGLNNNHAGQYFLPHLVEVEQKSVGLGVAE